MLCLEEAEEENTRFYWYSGTVAVIRFLLDRASTYSYSHTLTTANFSEIFTQELEGTRRRERPRKGWKEEVERDLQVLGVRIWRELVADRKKMEGHCSTGQSPQWAVVAMEEYFSKITSSQNVCTPH